MSKSQFFGKNILIPISLFIVSIAIAVLSACASSPAALTSSSWTITSTVLDPMSTEYLLTNVSADDQSKQVLIKIISYQNNYEIDSIAFSDQTSSKAKKNKNITLNSLRYTLGTDVKDYSFKADRILNKSAFGTTVYLDQTSHKTFFDHILNNPQITFIYRFDDSNTTATFDLRNLINLLSNNHVSINNTANNSKVMAINSYRYKNWQVKIDSDKQKYKDDVWYGTEFICVDKNDQNLWLKIRYFKHDKQKARFLGLTIDDKNPSTNPKSPMIEVASFRHKFDTANYQKLAWSSSAESIRTTNFWYVSPPDSVDFLLEILKHSSLSITYSFDGIKKQGEFNIKNLKEIIELNGFDIPIPKGQK